MEWYYAEAGKQIGPIDQTSFESSVAAGVIRDDTLVWRAGMQSWQPYQAVKVAAPAAPADGAAAGVQTCSECGKQFPPDEMVAFGNAYVCAACKPIYAQKLQEGVRLPGAVRYGGFWLRCAALIVDSVALYMVGMVFFAIAFAISSIDWMNPVKSQADVIKLLSLEGGLLLVNIVVAAVYETWLIGRYGATLGKMVCQLKVVMSDGGKLSYGRALGRHFAKYLSSFTLGIGYIMAGVDDEKRALHDRICDTRVVKK